VRMYFACILLVACATTGEEGKGDENLPTAGVGPFRKLDGEEVPGVAPFVLDDRNVLFREPCALDDNGDMILYAVGRFEGKDVIVRSRSKDGRAFYGTSVDSGHTVPIVLRADQPWEGAAVGGPYVIRNDAGFLLYYSAAGGIGVARSVDGLSFTKEPGPILADASGPAVYVGQDGKHHLFFGTGNAIGEAVSDDAIHFTRLPDLVLAPAPPAPPGSLLPNEKPPFDTVRVSDPTVVTRITPAGRFHVRVIYAGLGDADTHAIGFAARYGDSGPLSRNPVPVFAVNQKETAPAFVDRGEIGTFLYVQQQRRIDADLQYPAIAAAYAPGNIKLGTPATFPDTP
jgi:hypothetical protein